MEVVHLLIERGVDVTAQDNHRQTPLHWASESGHMEVAHFLVERDVDTTV